MLQIWVTWRKTLASRKYIMCYNKENEGKVGMISSSHVQKNVPKDSIIFLWLKAYHITPIFYPAFCCFAIPVVATLLLLALAYNIHWLSTVYLHNITNSTEMCRWFLLCFEIWRKYQFSNAENSLIHRPSPKSWKRVRCSEQHFLSHREGHTA